MRLVIHIPRRKPLHWMERSTVEALLSGKPVSFVANSREQAERTYQAAKSLINGRDPKAHSG